MKPKENYTYSVVETIEKGVRKVVAAPDLWIKKNILHWPIKNAYAKRKRPTPPEKEWTQDKCIILAHGFTSLQEALEKEKAKSQFSNSESEMENKKKQELKRKHPVQANNLIDANDLLKKIKASEAGKESEKKRQNEDPDVIFDPVLPDQLFEDNHIYELVPRTLSFNTGNLIQTEDTTTDSHRNMVSPNHHPNNSNVNSNYEIENDGHANHSTSTTVCQYSPQSYSNTDKIAQDNAQNELQGPNYNPTDVNSNNGHANDLNSTMVYSRQNPSQYHPNPYNNARNNANNQLHVPYYKPNDINSSNGRSDNTVVSIRQYPSLYHPHPDNNSHNQLHVPYYNPNDVNSNNGHALIPNSTMVSNTQYKRYPDNNNARENDIQYQLPNYDSFENANNYGVDKEQFRNSQSTPMISSHQSRNMNNRSGQGRTLASRCQIDEILPCHGYYHNLSANNGAEEAQFKETRNNKVSNKRNSDASNYPHATISGKINVASKKKTYDPTPLKELNYKELSLKRKAAVGEVQKRMKPIGKKSNVQKISNAQGMSDVRKSKKGPTCLKPKREKLKQIGTEKADIGIYPKIMTLEKMVAKPPNTVLPRTTTLAEYFHEFNTSPTYSTKDNAAPIEYFPLIFNKLLAVEELMKVEAAKRIETDKRLERMEKVQMKILQGVASSETATRAEKELGEVDIREFDANYPVKEADSMDNLELNLYTKPIFKEMLTIRMARFGAKKPQLMVRKCMKYLIADLVLEEYSWHRTDYKKPFDEFKTINTTILNSVKRVFKDYTEYEYNTYMVDYVKQAKFRELARFKKERRNDNARKDDDEEEDEDEHEEEYDAEKEYDDEEEYNGEEIYDGEREFNDEEENEHQNENEVEDDIEGVK